MQFLGNDHWSASFRVAELGRYEYTVRGWTDPFLTGLRAVRRRTDDEQAFAVDFLFGGALSCNPVLKDAARPPAERYATAMALKSPPPDPSRVLQYERTLQVVVDPVRARFSSWYELFPRSVRGDGKHASLRDLIAFLPEVEAMGFDVLYLPPVHPIGMTERKGKNNALKAKPEEVGSPWAIGAKEGGHKALHPQLGTFADFDALVAEARRRGISVALDIAFQCSPDHPYVREHPEWFKQRPGGTVQYAENPPKKYQDIYPFDFESKDWRGLWAELKSIFEFWIGHGVTIFRVDNPHTKAFAFWESCIPELKAEHPELIFLSEAFTRPRVMHRLAKLGFTQSYTYFTWRNTRWELTEYFTELAQQPSREYFRPNVWPNTPDILHEYLQHGGRPAFIARLVLATTRPATLTSCTISSPPATTPGKSGATSCSSTPTRCRRTSSVLRENNQLVAVAEAQPALPDTALWYKDAVIYQLHVKAFLDSNGDGIGDFRGLTAKLDYIQELGVNAVWLLPFYPSPLKDDGYDVADYRNLHPHYGTREDFRSFVAEPHRRGLKVITELVINHTSAQHTWFEAARRP